MAGPLAGGLGWQRGSGLAVLGARTEAAWGRWEMTGAEALIAGLRAAGVEVAAVLCGHGLAPILEAADSGGLRLVDFRNEQAASYFADAYARLTGRLGVCFASSGVAHVHALAGVANAWFDGAPVLLISGAAASSELGRGAFQEMDQVAVARPLCKRAELVAEAGEIPAALADAIAAAVHPTPGPVHLTVTLDALTGPVDAAPTPAAAKVAVPRGLADPAEVERAAALIAQSQRPLIVAGTGCFYAGAFEALRALAEALPAPVITPIWDRGVVDADWDLFMGVVGAATGRPRLLELADCIILAGARPDYRLAYLDSPPLRPDAQIVRLDSDRSRLEEGRRADAAICGHPVDALAALAEALAATQQPDRAAWLQEAQEAWAEFYARIDGAPEEHEGLPTGLALVRALERALPEDAILIIDGGNIGQWAHMVLCRQRYPAHWLTCGASAVVGYGIAAAMAARAAFPDRPVVLLSGDGSIGFGFVELASAARQGLGFAVVLADDQAWAIVSCAQREKLGRTIASELGPVDWAAAARGLGARGVPVADFGELVDLLPRAAMSDRPWLLHCRIAQLGPQPFARRRADAE